MFSFAATLHFTGAVPEAVHEPFGPAAIGQFSRDRSSALATETMHKLNATRDRELNFSMRMLRDCEK
jgi:hypothetical protein